MATLNWLSPACMLQRAPTAVLFSSCIPTFSSASSLAIVRFRLHARLRSCAAAMCLSATSSNQRELAT